MVSRFAAVTNEETSQIIEKAFPEIHEEGDEILLEGFTGKALSKLNFSSLHGTVKVDYH